MNRLITGINWVINGITRVINGITRLTNGWGPGRGPGAAAVGGDGWDGGLGEGGGPGAAHLLLHGHTI